MGKRPKILILLLLAALLTMSTPANSQPSMRALKFAKEKGWYKEPDYDWGFLWRWIVFGGLKQW